MGPNLPSDPAANRESPARRGSVGRYELRAELGSGGMGTVWRAFDPALEREVAVKEVHLPAELPPRERERARARVVREARAAARISHPSVVTVHDVLEVDGTPFIVMELLDGGSLRERLRRAGPLSAAEAERIARPLLGALRAAHRAGVIHRDVKPANIMLSEDGRRPVLTDFGIANLHDGGATALTGTGAILGTAEYAAPERLDRDETTPASDLWSLGATLFAALAGTSPFKRETLTSTLTAVLTMPVPPAPAGGRVGAVVGGLLDRDPRRRLTPDGALALLDGSGPGLARGSAGPHGDPVPPTARPPRSAAPLPAPPVVAPPSQRPPRPSPSRRSPWRVAPWVAAAGLAVVSTGAAATWALTRDAAGTGDGAVVAVESGGPAAGASGTGSVPEGFTVLEDDSVRLAYPEDWTPVDVRDGDDGSTATLRLAEYDFETGVDTATVTVSATDQEVVLLGPRDSHLRMEEILTDGAEYTEVERVRLEDEPAPEGFESAVYEVTFRHGEREIPERWLLAREITDLEDAVTYRVTLNLPATARETHAEVVEEVVDSLAPTGG
ncbi:protein kinase [Nocardiopsis sp. NPDC050513]|uniref:serine/threonine-protein kinase n=1 Tax=Nocardiopsis sp. NPDC050513 TaxID=3364338 RepID=UPI00378D8658